MRRLFEQIKRRNVLRAAAGYAVVAWLVIQVADTVFPLLGVPLWVTTMVVLLIIIGFPVTIVISWIYQWTPGGIMTEQEADAAGYTEPIGIGRQIDFVIIVLLVIAVGWLAYDKTVEAPAHENSIAVLPFVNLSSDKEQEYFSDGIAEEILNLLAKFSDLTVIARTSSFAFKGKNEDIREIGRKLGVAHVLEGSVRKSGDRVRITAQLIDVSNGSHIWSETYDRTMINIFAVQDDVATAILDALLIHVGTSPLRGRPTGNMEAYVLFLKAKAAFNLPEYRDAKEYLLEAIALDPDFAEAHQFLAYTYWASAGIDEAVEDAQLLQNESAARALAIDPDLSFAQAMFQSSNGQDSSFVRNVEAFTLAAREHPSDPATLDILSFIFLVSGYLPDAISVAEQRVERDPLSTAAVLALANALYAAERTSDALATLQVAEQLDPGFADWFIGETNLAEERDDIAIAHFEADLNRNGLPNDWVRELVSGVRDPSGGQAYLDQRIPRIIAAMPEEKRFESQVRLRTWYLLFGFTDRYFEILFENLMSEEEVWTGIGFYVQAGTIHRRQGFTAHPKYIELVKWFEYTDQWERSGPPDYCKEMSGQWACE